MSQEEKPRTLTEFLSDPQTAREATDLLDRLRNLAVKMGGGAPIADSLAGSFALLGDASARAQFDEIRRGLVAHLRTLDLPATQTTVPAPFECSPEVSEADVEAAARVLVGSAAGPRSRT